VGDLEYRFPYIFTSGDFRVIDTMIFVNRKILEAGGILTVTFEHEDLVVRAEDMIGIRKQLRK
jgi:hypothetical protein